MDMISLDAAVAITGISRSTLWRRVTDGRIGKGGKDARSRALLVLADVLPLAEVPLGAGDLPVLLQADAGAAEAQADMGALFYVAGAEKAALYWLNEAAAQGHADAMQWLGIAHYAASGGGGAESTHAGAGRQPRPHVDRPGSGAGAPGGAAANGRAAARAAGRLSSCVGGRSDLGRDGVAGALCASSRPRPLLRKEGRRG